MVSYREQVSEQAGGCSQLGPASRFCVQRFLLDRMLLFFFCFSFQSLGFRVRACLRARSCRFVD